MQNDGEDHQNSGPAQGEDRTTTARRAKGFFLLADTCKKITPPNEGAGERYLDVF